MQNRATDGSAELINFFEKTEDLNYNIFTYYVTISLTPAIFQMSQCIWWW